MEPRGDGGEKEGSGIFGSVCQSESCIPFLMIILSVLHTASWAKVLITVEKLLTFNQRIVDGLEYLACIWSKNSALYSS